MVDVVNFVRGLKKGEISVYVWVGESFVCVHVSN